MPIRLQICQFVSKHAICFQICQFAYKYANLFTNMQFNYKYDVLFTNIPICLQLCLVYKYANTVKITDMPIYF